MAADNILMARARVYINSAINTQPASVLLTNKKSIGLIIKNASMEVYTMLEYYPKSFLQMMPHSPFLSCVFLQKLYHTIFLAKPVYEHC